MSAAIERPVGRRRRLIVTLVAVVVVVIGAGVFAVHRLTPDYRTAFLIDASAAGDFTPVAEAVGEAAQNAGSGDALSLRRFGGACGDPRNTAQVVGSGTGHGRRIGDSARRITPSGKATLESGILAAIDDFSGRYPFRGRKSNRIIVVTGHGTDACTEDQVVLGKTIQNKMKAVGLRLEFRFVGYKTPAGQQQNLTKIAAVTGAPDPAFVSTPARLTTTLKQLVIPKSTDALPIKTPSPSIEPTKPMNLGRFTIAAPTAWKRVAVNLSEGTEYQVVRGRCAQDTFSCSGFFVAYGKATMFLGIRPFDLGSPYASQTREDGEGASCPGHPDLEPAEEANEGIRLTARASKSIGGRTAEYREWSVACFKNGSPDKGPPAGVSGTERIWYMPQAKILIVDGWETPNLAAILQKAVWH